MKDKKGQTLLGVGAIIMIVLGVITFILAVLGSLGIGWFGSSANATVEAVEKEPISTDVLIAFSILAILLGAGLYSIKRVLDTILDIIT